MGTRKREAKLLMWNLSLHQAYPGNYKCLVAD